MTSFTSVLAVVAIALSCVSASLSICAVVLLLKSRKDKR